MPPSTLFDYARSLHDGAISIVPSRSTPRSCEAMAGTTHCTFRHVQLNYQRGRLDAALGLPPAALRIDGARADAQSDAGHPVRHGPPGGRARSL